MNFARHRSIQRMDHSKKCSRTTHEQINAYLTFLEENPGMQHGSSRPNYVNEKWKELTVILNSRRGPTRNAQQWRLSLKHWKNQLKSRTKKIMNQQSNGNLNSITLTSIEERALVLFGDITAGAGEQKTKIDMDFDVSIMDPMDGIDATNFIKKEIPSDSSDLEDAPTSENITLRNQSISSTATDGKNEVPNIEVNSREFDKRMAIARLEIDRKNSEAMGKIAEAVVKMADALHIFAQLYAKNNDK